MIKRFLFLTASCYGISAVAAELDRVVVPLSHPANGSIIHLEAEKQLAVSGFSQFERWLSVVDLQSYDVTPVTIPADAQFFSQAALVSANATTSENAKLTAEQTAEQATDEAKLLPVTSQLVFLGTEGVSRINPQTGETEQLIASPSVYRVLDKARLRESPFVVDLGSGRSDFLIPDFNYNHLYRQQPDGSFIHYPLAQSPHIQTWRESPEYRPRDMLVVDVNQDKNSDLLFVQNGKFHVFMQQADGSFAPQPQVLPWPVTLSTEQQADQRNDAGRSYTGQHIDRLREITDIDGDGLADLVIEREQMQDALERTNSYRLHFATATEQGLTYAEQPNTSITTDTAPIDVVIDDFNNDGRKDFYIPSTHFGVGTIIRVLLRGSASLDIDFYLLNADKQYSKKADFRQHATIDVSISNFRFDMPLFTLADLTGNGQKSLLIGDGAEHIEIRSPDGKRLFSRRSSEFKQNLPRDARRVKVFDLTGNGKDDIILPFDTQDDEKLRNQLHLLLSR